MKRPAPVCDFADPVRLHVPVTANAVIESPTPGEPDANTIGSAPAGTVSRIAPVRIAAAHSP
jgi:hypothetical protein